MQGSGERNLSPARKITLQKNCLGGRIAFLRLPESSRFYVERSYFLPRTLHRFLETISAIAFSFSNFCNGYISEELKKRDVKDWSIYNYIVP